EQPLLPAHTLQVAAPKPPVPAQIDCHTEGRARVVLTAPRERSTEVVVVGIQACKPHIPPPWDGNLGVRCLDVCEVVREVAIADRIGLTGLGELLLAILAQGLE